MNITLFSPPGWQLKNPSSNNSVRKEASQILSRDKWPSGAASLGKLLQDFGLLSRVEHPSSRGEGGAIGDQLQQQQQQLQFGGN